MPEWVLLLSKDSVGAATWEQEIRLAGYSSARAPDLERAEVLIRRGGGPAVVVVDLESTGEEGLAASRSLAGRTGATVAIVSGDGSVMEDRAERAGMVPVSREHAAAGGLARSIVGSCQRVV